MPIMRTLLAELGGTTWAAVAVGLLVGALWLVSLPAALALSGLVAPIGAILLVTRRRWLDIGLLIAGIGIVPLVAYRLFGAPIVEPPFREDAVPVELLAPGTAYVLFVIGAAVLLVAGTFELRNARRREGEGARGRTRAGERNP
jgi:hypothetical protein